MRWAVWLVAAALVAGAGAARAQETPTEAANKALAIAFYQTLLNDKDGPAAAAMTADGFVDLYPGPKPGRDGVLNFAKFLQERRPQTHTEIVRAFADGDYVVLYANTTDGPGQPAREIVEFFKVQDGKLTEHWDVPAAPPQPAAATR
jgi:predicted SnoaL-like aldol condensation-catalyzing enzyme